MACNKCGHTKSSPCACQDHGLTTPCSYSDCTRGASTETCEDIQCAECVSYCQETFSVTQGGNTLGVTEGERLDFILQRFALFIQYQANWDKSILHLFRDTLTNSTVKLMWQGVPNGVTAIKVHQANAGGAYSLIATLGAGATEYQVTGLTPATNYQFKVAATVGGTDYDSVDLFITTL